MYKYKCHVEVVDWWQEREKVGRKENSCLQCGVP